MAILNLANLPIGTLLGAYVIWVLLQDKAAEYSATPQPPAPPADAS